MSRHLNLAIVFFVLNSGLCGAADPPPENSEAASGTVVTVPKQPAVSPSGTVKPADFQKSTAMAKAMALGGMAQSRWI